MAPIIKMENICKTYQYGENTVYALKGVNLSVGRGEFLAITGVPDPENPR